MNNSKISVGITAYKNSEYLMEALNSLIDQSVDSWEGIFILDKGADTKTKNIFNSFKHPRILKHRCKHHKGAEQARHEAIKLSSTNWFFLTGDKQTLTTLAVDDLKMVSLPKEESKRETPTDLFIHSSLLILVDQKGQVRASFDSGSKDLLSEIQSALRRINR